MKLNIKEGDKIIFLEKPNGEIVLQSTSAIAIRQAQSKFGDIQLSENEILQEVMDIRYGKKIINESYEVAKRRFPDKVGVLNDIFAQQKGR